MLKLLNKIMLLIQKLLLLLAVFMQLSTEFLHLYRGFMYVLLDVCRHVLQYNRVAKMLRKTVA